MKLMYKNIGTVTKTFYGVEFKPGDTKECSGYINAPMFIRINNKNEDLKNASSKSTPKSTTSDPIDTASLKSNSTTKSTDNKSTTSKPDETKGAKKNDTDAVESTPKSV